MTTDTQKLREHEYRMDRELDKHLTELDRDDEREWQGCPLGPSEHCRGCKMRLDCEE